MKKKFKIIIIVLGGILLLFVIDIISIYTINKPIFAIKKDCDCLDKIYYGLFYNTYNCWEYSTPQIKAKGTKFNCERNIIVGKIIEIKDDYIIINGLSDNSYLKTNQEAHISLTNNPKIEGANNLIVGQYLKIIPKSIKEIYPILITTIKIEIIYEEDIDF